MISRNAQKLFPEKPLRPFCLLLIHQHYYTVNKAMSFTYFV
jgi:hypothetical protein